jgi:hypothetical protein
MNEMVYTIQQRQIEERQLSPTTEHNYMRQYNYLTSLFGSQSDWVVHASNKKLVENIKSLESKDSNKLVYLNIFIIIKKYHNLDYHLLDDLRNKLMKSNEKHTVKNLEQKKEDLPTALEVETYINSLYKQQDWVNYLVNKLIFENCLRNKDINLYIISLANYKNKETDKSKNYLIIKSNETQLLIRDYKTKGVYGEKSIRLRSKKIYNAATRLGEGWLLQKADNSPVSMDALAYYIRLYEFNNKKLTESDYCKIRIFQIQQESNPLQKLYQISYSRGTDINTLAVHYNFDIK